MNKYQEALNYVKENSIILMHKGDDWKKAVDTLQELIDKNISKKRPKFISCNCGCNRRKHNYKKENGVNTYGLKCVKCGFYVEGNNETDVRLKWNKEMSNG